MEVAALATGVAGLITLASTVVDGLMYVQFARSFAADYGRAQLKIDLLGLQLSRWRESIGTVQSDALRDP